MGTAISSSEKKLISKSDKASPAIPVNMFNFMEPLKIPEIGSANGLIFNGIYLPEEMLIIILSHVSPKQLLKLSLVCKIWCNLIKSENLWKYIYNRKHPNKAKKLPWYVYYCYFTTDNFKNLLRNGNGEKKFQYWTIKKNLGDGFRIEDPPSGSDPLPNCVPDFNGKTSCFSTSFYECRKTQVINIGDKRLLKYIIRKFRPHIYVSEWVAGRYDCGCIYKLVFRGFLEQELTETSEEEFPEPVFEITNIYSVEQWHGKKWQKIELLVEKYPEDILSLQFEHEGRDTQFWKGHYGSKMAGGVVKFLFDSIQPEVKIDQLLDDNY